MNISAFSRIKSNLQAQKQRFKVKKMECNVWEVIVHCGFAGCYFKPIQRLN